MGPKEERKALPPHMKTKPKPEKPDPHRGISFDDFLKEQGIYKEIMASPKIKKAIRGLGDSIQAEMHEAFAAG